ncbi:hypothetical protein [Sphingobium sp. UBA5915]|uniref:hypothetical protein n=1 Tax=Sphingobium sp. UBA5915 TaxID=1947530 RepID=UPI0025DE2B6B|nr:hypothetical protein [Sphingobium sp. UBA5915]
MTPLERAARAIARMDAEFTYGTACTDADRAACELEWREYLANVCAVLTAIREPNNRMIGAGRVVLQEGERKTVEAYQAMIDAMLEEG